LNEQIKAHGMKQKNVKSNYKNKIIELSNSWAHPNFQTNVHARAHAGAAADAGHHVGPK